MMHVDWIKNTTNGQWFDFLRLNLESSYFLDKRGVYVIWYTSPSQAKVIYVGQGNIGERLKEHRQNPSITHYSQYGQLKVSWAIIPNDNWLNGIEAYLADLYNPTEAKNYPNVTRMPVNPLE